jgi:DeoR family transcriptional regulator, glycerol-3-phosphate regulon repressor
LYGLVTLGNETIGCPIPGNTMKPVSPRQHDIVDRARHQGRVIVDDLAEHFNVTPQTIRKDLNELCDRGILQRVHGGGILISGVTNYDYEARRVLASDEKRRIAVKAASLIPNNSSLMINIGTTTEQIAHVLRGKRGIMVITNSINVVNTLQGTPDIEVIIAGGLVRPTDGGVVGEATVDFIRQFKMDYAIISASAIDEDGSILDYDYREVKVAQAIIENARHCILVADSTKFERSAPVRIGHISQLSSFVTDNPPPPSFAAVCKENDVDLIVAEEI